MHFAFVRTYIFGVGLERTQDHLHSLQVVDKFMIMVVDCFGLLVVYSGRKMHVSRWIFVTVFS